MHGCTKQQQLANKRSSAQLVSSFTYGWLLATGLPLPFSTTAAALCVVSATAPDDTASAVFAQVQRQQRGVPRRGHRRRRHLRRRLPSRALLPVQPLPRVPQQACQCRGRRCRNRTAAAALAARPRAPPRPEPWDNEEQWLRRHRSDRDDDGRTRRASLTAGLPSFTYNRTVRHNVTGSGDEAATCSVCLGAFQVGETVRLLPVCMHLYHVECIDPWLEAHATCPLCRSGTEESTMHGRLLLPV